MVSWDGSTDKVPATKCLTSDNLLNPRLKWKPKVLPLHPHLNDTIHEASPLHRDKDDDGHGDGGDGGDNYDGGEDDNNN